MNTPNNHNLFTPAMILSLLVLFCSCSSTKIALNKEAYNDTTTLNKHDLHYFYTSYRLVELEKVTEFATTDAQKKAAIGLNYIFQNKYDSATTAFMDALKQKDSLDAYWQKFITNYYSFMDYDWQKLKELATIRPDIATEEWYRFYIDKPEFNINFIKDSVVIPLEFDAGIPQIVIEINGKKFVFLIDTGCDKTLFYQNIITHLATNDCDTSNKFNANAPDGTITGYNCFLPQFDLGDIEINNFPIFTLEQDELKIKELLFITILQCDGIIGWDLLHHFDFTIDYKNAQLVLRKPIKKEVKKRNLFWYQQPLVLFYTENNFPITIFFDSGTNLTAFDGDFIIDKLLKLDKDKLKNSNISTHGANDWTKNTYYNLPNFNMFTISDTTINHLTASTARFSNLDIIRNGQPMYIAGWLGSDWFKDKIVRVDMTNGIFEISE